MIDEYIIKSTSEYFPSLIGANDIYLAFSNYLIKYAKVVKAVNENLISKEGFNSTSDVKFVMIDLYSRVVVDTFSNVETKNDLNVIKEDLNINKIDESFKFRYSYIDDSDAIVADVTEFIRYYNLCNKELFADKFVETISLATGIDENSTAEIKAAFYYNKIF